MISGLSRYHVGKDELTFRDKKKQTYLLRRDLKRYAISFTLSAGKAAIVAGPPSAVAASLARSLGSTRQTGQINESIKIAVI